MCLPVTPNPPSHPRERERGRETFRVERYKSVSGWTTLQTFRVVSVFFSATAAGERGTRGGGRNGRHRGACAVACKRLLVFVHAHAFARVHFCVAAFWTLSDVGRGQSGKGGAVRTVSPGACVDYNRYPRCLQGGNLSPFSRRAWNENNWQTQQTI